MMRSNVLRALPGLVLVAACATAPDEAASTLTQDAVEPTVQEVVLEPRESPRQPQSFEAVVVVTRTPGFHRRLLRPVTAVMEFEPLDRFWLESADAESFQVRLSRQEDNLLAYEGCDTGSSAHALDHGEHVTLVRVGRIPGLDDDESPRRVESCVPPFGR